MALASRRNGVMAQPRTQRVARAQGSGLVRAPGPCKRTLARPQRLPVASTTVAPTAEGAAAEGVASSAATSSSGAPTPAPQAAPAPGSFSFAKAWWPVYDGASIDATRPVPLELLGRKLVLWRDGGGAWRCMEDACPHRLAPLSEGRVDGGQLECSYHGWKFNGQGQCTRIPQAIDEKAAATACASPRSCVKSYPVKEAGGMLWVWGHPGSPSEAAAAPLPIPRAMEEAAAAGKALRWYRRVLPYSYDVLLENVTDPAHLPHSHHKLTPMLTRDKAGPLPLQPLPPPHPGSHPAHAPRTASLAPLPPDPAHLPHSHHKLTPMLTRDKAGPMPFKPVEALGAAVAAEVGGADVDEAAAVRAAAAAAADSQQHAGGNTNAAPAAAAAFAFPYAPPVGAYEFPSALSSSGKVAFNAPCSVVYEYALPGGANMWTLIYATPAAPGRSIVHTSSANNLPKAKWTDVFKVLTNVKALLPLLFRLRAQSMPLWQTHQISNRLFDQDNVFLHQQDLLLEARGRTAWSSTYYMPEQCDSLVIKTRRWIDAAAEGGPIYVDGAGGIAPLTKQQIQDRWEQHTKHCVPCQQAMQQLQKRGASAKAAAAALFAALCALLGTYGAGGLAAGGAPAALAVAAAVGLAVTLRAARGAAAAVETFRHVPFNHADNH